MNCADAGRRMPAYGDGRLAVAERESLEAHLGGCSDCRREAERARANSTFLSSRLRGLPVIPPPDLDAVQAAASVRAGPPPPRRGYRIVAVALTLLVLAGAIWFLTRDREPEPRTDVTAVPTEQPAEPGPEPVAPAEPEVPPEVPEVASDPVWPPLPPLPDRGDPENLLEWLAYDPSPALMDRVWMSAARGKISSGEILELLEESAVNPLQLLALLPVRDEPGVLEKLQQQLEEGRSTLVRVAAAAAIAATRDFRTAVEWMPVYGAITVRVGPIEDTVRRHLLVTAAQRETDPYVLGRIGWLLGPSAGLDAAVEDALYEMKRSRHPVVEAVASVAISRYLGHGDD